MATTKSHVKVTMQAHDPQSQVRFPALYKFRAPSGFHQAIAAAARLNHTTGSEYVRRLLLREMKKDGVTLRDDGVVERLAPEALAR